jgi:glycerol-3-phosphate O-acyltransferase/dihydroxyacetone phosphate acyltransferase
MYRAFFRNIYINNRERVPLGKPVLLAVNHPTAFLEPFLLCTYLDPPLYNMARGDIFRKPWVRKVLYSLNMFPVFRAKDGYTGRNRHDDMLRFCYERLRASQVVSVYVEGMNHLEKHVRPVQRGVAAIAFHALVEDGLDDLVIVPAGCNYVWGERARDTAFVNIGEPIEVRAFRALHEEQPRKAMNDLCAAVEAALKSLCYHVEDTRDFKLAEDLLTLHRSDAAYPALPVVQFDHLRFWREKAVLDTLNTASEADKSQWSTALKAYNKALKTAGLDDYSVVGAPRWRWAWALYFLAFFPVFAIGRITSFPVMAVAKTITRAVVRRKEFISSVWLASGYLFGMLYYLTLLVLAIALGGFLHGIIAILLPALGWYAMLYREHFLRWWGMGRAWMSGKRAVLMALRPTP